MWRTLLMTIFVTALHTSAAHAQPLGYAVAGPTANSGGFGGLALHAGGGGEFLARGIGVGAELGLLTNGGSALGVVSLNGVAHFRTTTSGKSPFITGGYSRFSSGEGTFDAWNVGVGSDFWYAGRVGLRVEFRDHVRPRFNGAVHYFTVRFGIAVK